jgi:hypothetical protein
MVGDRAHENQVYRGYHPCELALFDRFRPAPVPPEPGFVTDFLNTRTRVALLWEEVRSLDGQRLGLPIPGDYRAEGPWCVDPLGGVEGRPFS